MGNPAVIPPGEHRKVDTTSMLDEHPDRIDVPFAVPFMHRLRFTQDVLGPDRHVLADLLHASGSRKARVQLWVDESLLARRPDLRPWAGFLDDAVEVGVDEVQGRRRTAVAQERRLDVLQPERLAQGVVQEIDLADGQVVGGAPVGVELAQQVRRQGPGSPCPGAETCGRG
jgi:hypothetical protein